MRLKMRSRNVSPRHAPGRQWWAFCFPAVAAAALLCSCAVVPDLGAPPQPRAITSFATAQSFEAPGVDWPTDQWWRIYGDPQLDQLVAEALAKAPSLAQASARLREADPRAGLATAGP